MENNEIWGIQEDKIFLQTLSSVITEWTFFQASFANKRKLKA
jgi:hypothetical protein